MGLMGLIFSSFIYLFVILRGYKILTHLKNLSNKDKIILLSLLGSCGYPLLLSATYKSVTFGFVLALLLIFKSDVLNGKIDKK